MRSSSGKYADKLAYTVTIAAEKTDDEPTAPVTPDNTSDNCGSIILWSSVSVGSALIVGLAVFLILKFRRRK